MKNNYTLTCRWITCIVILTLFNCFKTYGQIASVDKTTNTVVIDTSDERKIEYVLRNEFSRIAQTNTGGGLGNLVGISTANNTLSFAYNFVYDNEMFELNVTGGASDGIGNIVSNNKINTNVGVGFRYKRMFKPKIAINQDKFEAIKNEGLNARYDRHIYVKSLDINLRTLAKDTLTKFKAVKKLHKKRVFLEGLELKQNAKPKQTVFLDDDKEKQLTTKQNALLAEKQLLDHQLKQFKTISAKDMAGLIKVYKKIKSPTTLQTLIFKKDSVTILAYEAKLKDSINSKKAKLLKIKEAKDSNVFKKEMVTVVKEELEVAKLKFEKSLNKYKYYEAGWNVGESSENYFNALQKIADKINDIRAESIRLQWYTLGASFKNESFTLYDSSLPLEDRIYSETDLSPTVEASYTYYVNEYSKNPGCANRRNIRYFTIGGNVTWGNNINSLKQIEIQTVDSISPNQNNISTQKAFSGLYESAVISAKLFSDYYHFIGNRNNAGFHLKALVNIGEHAPVTSLRAGVLLAALNRENQKSIINFEVFYGLNNIFKSGGEDTILDRNIFGIQATFPFDFNINP